MSTRGGARQGSGRKPGSGKYGERTVPVRVPFSRVGEVRRLVEEDRWRSIRTAPKDGTRIWLWFPNLQRYQVGWFGKGDNPYAGGEFGEPCWRVGRSYFYGACPEEPSLWMPLPPAPTENINA